MPPKRRKRRKKKPQKGSDLPDLPAPAPVATDTSSSTPASRAESRAAKAAAAAVAAAVAAVQHPDQGPTTEEHLDLQQAKESEAAKRALARRAAIDAARASLSKRSNAPAPVHATTQPTPTNQGAADIKEPPTPSKEEEATPTVETKEVVTTSQDPQATPSPVATRQDEDATPTPEPKTVTTKDNTPTADASPPALASTTLPSRHEAHHTHFVNILADAAQFSALLQFLGPQQQHELLFITEVDQLIQTTATMPRPALLSNIRKIVRTYLSVHPADSLHYAAFIRSIPIDVRSRLERCVGRSPSLPSLVPIGIEVLPSRRHERRVSINVQASAKQDTSLFSAASAAITASSPASAMGAEAAMRSGLAGGASRSAKEKGVENVASGDESESSMTEESSSSTPASPTAGPKKKEKKRRWLPGRDKGKDTKPSMQRHESVDSTANEAWHVVDTDHALALLKEAQHCVEVSIYDALDRFDDFQAGKTTTKHIGKGGSPTVATHPKVTPTTTTATTEAEAYFTMDDVLIDSSCFRFFLLFLMETQRHHLLLFWTAMRAAGVEELLLRADLAALGAGKGDASITSMGAVETAYVNFLEIERRFITQRPQVPCLAELRRTMVLARRQKKKTRRGQTKATGTVLEQRVRRLLRLATRLERYLKKVDRLLRFECWPVFAQSPHFFVLVELHMRDQEGGSVTPASPVKLGPKTPKGPAPGKKKSGVKLFRRRRRKKDPKTPVAEEDADDKVAAAADAAAAGSGLRYLQRQPVMARVALIPHQGEEQEGDKDNEAATVGTTMLFRVDWTESTPQLVVVAQDHRGSQGLLEASLVAQFAMPAMCQCREARDAQPMASVGPWGFPQTHASRPTTCHRFPLRIPVALTDASDATQERLREWRGTAVHVTAGETDWVVVDVERVTPSQGCTLVERDTLFQVLSDGCDTDADVDDVCDLVHAMISEALGEEAHGASVLTLMHPARLVTLVECMLQGKHLLLTSRDVRTVCETVEDLRRLFDEVFFVQETPCVSWLPASMVGAMLKVVAARNTKSGSDAPALVPFLVGMQHDEGVARFCKAVHGTRPRHGLAVVDLDADSISVHGWVKHTNSYNGVQHHYGAMPMTSFGVLPTGARRGLFDAFRRASLMPALLSDKTNAVFSHGQTALDGTQRDGLRQAVRTKVLLVLSRLFRGYQDYAVLLRDQDEACVLFMRSDFIEARETGGLPPVVVASGPDGVAQPRDGVVGSAPLVAFSSPSTGTVLDALKRACTTHYFARWIERRFSATWPVASRRVVSELVAYETAHMRGFFADTEILRFRARRVLEAQRAAGQVRRRDRASLTRDEEASLLKAMRASLLADLSHSKVHGIRGERPESPLTAAAPFCPMALDVLLQPGDETDAFLRFLIDRSWQDAEVAAAETDDEAGYSEAEDDVAEAEAAEEEAAKRASEAAAATRAKEDKGKTKKKQKKKKQKGNHQAESPTSGGGTSEDGAVMDMEEFLS